MVKVTKSITSRPIFVFFLMVFLVIVSGTIPIMIWHRTTKNTTMDVALFTQDLRSSLVSQIEKIGKFTYPKTDSLTIGLARVIDSYLTKNTSDFTAIQTQIAPVLFQAYSMIPQVSQVSYISTDGLLFSYITESNTNVAVFANSSDGGGDYTWYTQTVDQITGRLKGDATKSQPSDVTNTDWFQAAQRNYTTAFVRTGLGGEDNEKLFQNVVSLYSKKGVVLLGFPVKTLTGVLKRLKLKGGELYMWTKDGTLLVRQGSLNASFFISNGSTYFGEESLKSGNCSSRSCLVEIERSKFEVFCSVLEVSGVPLRYTLMFPNKRRRPSIENASLYLLIATMFLGLCWPLGFVAFMVHTSRREMHMRATLINQMEATQQAERKSMNKSQAFARASHDIRGSLAGITGLIDLCREEVRLGSGLDTSLKQVNVCANDLVALLNTLLDTSKIESGKMHLEEEEFNLAKLLEDVVDFFHPVAMKKGVDVVLDTLNGSVFKFSNVRGDSGKLKQILNNLVSNAVKFTSEGHISVRAWAQRPGSTSSVVLVSDTKGGLSKFSKCMFCKNKDQSSSYEMEMSSSIRNNANTMEFVFEVDDTGKGIPMEMRKSVFENYVQVRETAQGQQGTGLGLGIVQSLVRLMGGEIRITDKAIGEKGTCFQFNVLLTTLESPVSDMRVRQDIEAGSDHISTPNLGLIIRTSLGGSINIRNMSPRFNNWLSLSPKQERSRVVLLLKDEERRKVTEKHIRSLGIKVTVVKRWEHLNHALERLFGFSPQSSMGRAECSLRNESSSSSSRDLPLIGKNGVDSESQVPKARSYSFSAVFLLVIDAKTGPFPEMYEIVEQFRRGLHHGISFKVVWLNEPSGRGSERGDISCSKPLHGSRLNRVLKMLPEFGGTEPKEASTPLEGEAWVKSMCTGQKLTVKPEDKKGASKGSDDEFLNGKRVLVVDDDRTTSLLATRKLKKMGVSEVKQCNSGKEAVRLVSEWLTQREQQGVTEMLPFDYIFMDCQMPEMDGYEATRKIRKVERKYGVHIPIIAVSGHDPGSREARETIQAGMDAFLEKNLNQDQLAKAIREIIGKVQKP
ncbi:histidine kinase CKI1 [Eutrema salsugineum]|uniref:histidine kinase CKI1 n=1 Tax=Eutrema salsugineum TaxID=72664 RepID=UPI000CED46C7|nr:histidine kinase CKI1 [Eutrema salsugineum]